MSTSGPRYHIPFPKNFLSLNTPVKQATTGDASAAGQPVPVHNFLSNRTQMVPRHASVSSVSSITSDDSARSAPSSPPSQAADSPVLAAKVPAFLALNSKHEAATHAGEVLKGNPFLSNKH
ncbi:hypothetical protein B0J11DRAFT_277538 [Dendryphion nanum]|uniref:Uncharacterized protein n=1 Tax=Dendryphion nanum TaxID=256645 RepID=A0A9P9DYG6_9PLEO|nr:hypothetical protein B0J11DRAFT_277538 [Dendryphion nanum]